jgi:Polysaccharide pyruvyl transferase
VIDLKRVMGARIETQPYRWAAIGNLFSPGDAAALAATFPGDHFKHLAADDVPNVANTTPPTETARSELRIHSSVGLRFGLHRGSVSTQLRNSRAFIDDDLSPEELSNLYGSCRMVISSRLHAVILALLARVRAVSLAPEVTFKERSVLEIVGLDSLWIPTRAGEERAAATCLAIASTDDLAVAAAVAAARAQWNDVPALLRALVEKPRQRWTRFRHGRVL